MKKRLQCVAVLLLLTIGIMQGQCTKEHIIVPAQLSPLNTAGEPTNLVVEATGLRDMKMLIYSRWGTKLFEANNAVLNPDEHTTHSLDTGWDGKSLGRQLSAGIYVYTIEVTCMDRSIVRKTGTIVLAIEKNPNN